MIYDIVYDAVSIASDFLSWACRRHPGAVLVAALGCIAAQLALLAAIGGE